MPNLTKIGQTVTKIWPIFYFEDGGRSPSWIFKLEFLTARTLLGAKMRHCAKFREKLSKSTGNMTDF